MRAAFSTPAASPLPSFSSAAAEENFYRQEVMKNKCDTFSADEVSLRGEKTA